MIVFDLSCQTCDHRFEAWFRSSADFASQQAGGLLMCPQCASAEVEKALMAPALGRKGNQAKPEAAKPRGERSKGEQAVAQLPPEAHKALAALARAQAEVLAKSRWVGKGFAEEARAMHYGERKAEPIYGEASKKEAAELAEEGVEAAPLPFPVPPPDGVN